MFVIGVIGSRETGAAESATGAASGEFCSTVAKSSIDNAANRAAHKGTDRAAHNGSNGSACNYRSVAVSANGAFPATDQAAYKNAHARCTKVVCRRTQSSHAGTTAAFKRGQRPKCVPANCANAICNTGSAQVTKG